MQVKYQCTVCGKTTERKIHCDRQTIKVNGFSWINNDAVNIAAGISGAFLGYILADILIY